MNRFVFILALVLLPLLSPLASAADNFGNLGCAGATIANTTTATINNSASSTSLKIITGTASKQTHICAINVGATGGAVNVALVEGTTTTTACDTSTAGLAGGTTAATGWNFGANGGIAYGSGVGQLYVTATTGDNVCLLFSASQQVSGNVVWTQY